MSRIHRPLLLVVSVLFIAGCGDEPVTKDQAAPKPPASEQERLINNTRAASAVGYDGEALKRSVQQTVNIYDQHNAKVTEAAEAAGLADPPPAEPK